MDLFASLFAVIRFFVAAFFGVLAVYTGMRIFDKLTKELDEWEEIKKGNLAVAIFMASVIFSLVLVIEGSVSQIYSSFELTSFSAVLGLALFEVIKMAVTLLVGVAVVYIMIRIIDSMTPDVEELTEIKNGNVAMAIIVAIVLISMGFIISSTVNAIVSSIDPVELIASMFR